MAMTVQEQIEKAFDYRGDVTVHLQGGKQLVGFLFNRDAQVSEPFIEVYPANGSEPIRHTYAEIISVECTGKDTAAGRSWEAWLEKVEKAKAEGKIAELYPESLD